MKKLLLNLGAGLILFGFTSCSQTEVEDSLNEEVNLNSSDNGNEEFRIINSEKLRVFKGPQVQYGEGKLRSFVSFNDDDFPVEIGFIMTSGIFDNLEILPDDQIFTVLPLHQKAKEVTPFEHIGLKWSQGHGPVFFSQHFDLYFFMISNEERLAIPPFSPATESMFMLYPPDGFMPENYFAPPGEGGAFPQVGKHWLPANFPDYLPFTSIMVLGTFNGEFTFIQPMATVDFLLSNPDFSAPYSQPEMFQESTNYPTRYNIYVDPKTGDIYVSLSHFVAR